MSTETLTQTLVANTPVQFGAGTNFLVLGATAPLTIQAVQIGNSNKNRLFAGVLQGFSFKADDAGDGFDLLQVTSATAQTITLVVGDDDVSYPSTVNVAGSVQSVQVPAVAVADQAPVVTVANAQTALFPQNVNRRRITVFSDPTNAANAVIYLLAHGGANHLGCIVPGQSLEFDATYGVDYFCAAAGDTLYLWEES